MSELLEGRGQALLLDESCELFPEPGRGGRRGPGDREGLQAKGLPMRGKMKEEAWNAG